MFFGKTWWEKKEGAKGTKEFFGKNGPNFSDYEKKNLKLPYLENMFQQFTNL
jgi:hypothetical protein